MLFSVPPPRLTSHCSFFVYSTHIEQGHIPCRFCFSDRSFR
ncbi:hypothetical protein GCK32_021069 [Trichostrongylus colubriformis]|uniref:Uncharacterized protein n=1 Tax=Trichostrongylus colubriformis TaxID=6319 RepID=A0AAN8F7N0_TRICO